MQSVCHLRQQTLPRCVQSPSGNLDLSAVSVSANGEINVTSPDIIAVHLRMMTQQQPEPVLPLKAVQKRPIRYFGCCAAESSDTDTEKFPAVIIQQDCSAFDDSPPELICVPVLPFMIPDGIKYRHCFRDFPQKAKRIFIIAPVPVHQVPGNQDRVTRPEIRQNIVKRRAVQICGDGKPERFPYFR